MTDDSEDDLFSFEEFIFRDEHVFEHEFVPETFLHREKQIKGIQHALRPAVRGSQPLNAVVQGPPGTGKTTAIQLLFDELRAQTEIQAVRINCQMNPSRYNILSEIRQELFGYETPPEGIQFTKLLSQVTNHLVEEDEILVVALDDINYLYYESGASETLYSLLRAHEQREGVKIGVIAISSDLDLALTEELDGRVQSIFRPEEIYFPNYIKSEIIEILKERAKRGFQDGVIDMAILNRIAELTAKRGGDLRVGIDLLRRAGLNAERRESNTIQIQDVENGYGKSKYIQLSRQLEGLSDPEKTLLKIIAEHEGKYSNELYPKLRECTDIDHPKYNQAITKLEQLGIINAPFTGDDGEDRSRQLSLNYESEAVLSRL
jgi:cell division control protein 6